MANMTFVIAGMMAQNPMPSAHTQKEKRGRQMSVNMWAYDPNKCDNDYCPGCCYKCSKAVIDENHFPIELAIKILKEKNDEISGTPKKIR